jgi:hypothetical protein
MLKIYKPIPFVLMALFAVNAMCFAQDTTATQQPGKSKGYSEKHYDLKLDNLDAKINMGINHLVNNILVKVGDITSKVDFEVNGNEKNIDINVDPKIDLQLGGLLKNLNLDIDPDVHLNFSDDGNNQDNGQGYRVEKSKSYSKSYPIDGNDKIKLSNQYGRITVNTWDRHEIKVDVQIKAQAEDDGTAQKLLDGVQIRDSKSGDLVSFRTSIEPSNNSSWKIWEWGDKKKHKVEINYTVYMPAKTDLNVEDSYGGIELPDLAGKVKISCSYGSVQAQNLSNPADDIEGSYGSLKVASVNGARLDYSYGSVEMDECNNLKADLSYGSFKLGKLKGTADLDLSYMGGTKIEEMSAGFKRLNVNASYSGLSVGVPGNNNFDFDVTTTYGGFNYSDDKVTITSKTPDDSKHYSSTKNYKGHFGKGGSEAQVSVHSTYGSVSFE